MATFNYIHCRIADKLLKMEDIIERKLEVRKKDLSTLKFICVIERILFGKNTNGMFMQPSAKVINMGRKEPRSTGQWENQRKYKPVEIIF